MASENEPEEATAATSPRTKRAATDLASIARSAGVSVATASRVLNGSSHPVNPKTRQHVLEVAEQLNYRPSLLAQAIAKQQSKIIGVIVHDSVDPYFAEIVQGIEAVAISAGYLPIVCNARRSSELELDRLRLFTDYKAKGVIFTGSGSTAGSSQELLSTLEAAREDGMKIVSLAARDFESRTYIYDNEQAAFDVTQHLIDEGSKRVAFVAGSTGVLAAEARQRGYEAAVRAAGMAPQVSQGSFARESGVAAALNLVARGSKPDAVVASNDQTAVGIMSAFRNVGVQVPEELRVASIGSTSLARMLDLTTVGVHLQTLGTLAAKYVIDDDQPASNEKTYLPHTIEVRGSSVARSEV